MESIPRIKTVMTPFPHFIDIEASLRQARQMLIQHQIRHLPVKEGGSLVGVITDRDIKRALDPDVGLPPKDELLVRDVAVLDGYVVDLDAPLDNVLVHMAENHIGCALVAKGQRLAGIFTNTDACRVFAEHLRAEHHPPAGNDAA